MKIIKYITCTTVTALSISACTPTHSVRGNYLQDYQISTVSLNKDSEADIIKKLGSPTTRATFDDNTWYYIGQETEKQGILDPEVKEERIIIVTFNEEGIVSDVQEVDNDRLNIPYSRESTPTSGNDITVMQQLLGNLGRFNRTAPQ